MGRPSLLQSSKAGSLTRKQFRRLLSTEKTGFTPIDLSLGQTSDFALLLRLTIGIF